MKKLSYLLMRVVMGLSLIFPAYATETYNIKFVSHEHFHIYMKAVSEDKGIDEATEIYKGYVEKYPKNPSVRAYYASLLTKQGEHAWLPWSKMDFTNKGLDTFDEAIVLAENDTTTKGIDGRVSGALEAKAMTSMMFMLIPDKYFQRRHEGMTLAKEIVNLPEFQNKGFGVKFAFLGAYARALLDEGDYDTAKKYAQQILDSNPYEKEAETAKAILEDVAKKQSQK